LTTTPSTRTDDKRKTTWGDCPNQDCPFYGRLKYGIEPGVTCDEVHVEGCDSTLRWYDRWHDGEHHSTTEGDLEECERLRAIAL